MEQNPEREDTAVKIIKRNITGSFRHVRHFTKFTYAREAIGRSPYVTRCTRFRHMRADRETGRNDR